MMTFRRRLLVRLFKFFDLLVMTLWFTGAAGVSSNVFALPAFSQFLAMRIKIQNFAIFLGFLLAWHGIFSFLGMYRCRHLSSRREGVVAIVQAISVATVVIATASPIFRVRMVTVPFLAIFWIGASVTLVLTRLALWYGLERVRVHGRNLRNMLIVGTNPRAVHFAREIESKPGLGYRLLGFVDDREGVMDGFNRTGYALAADFDTFPVFLRSTVVDEVISPSRSSPSTSRRPALWYEHPGYD
jgi:FlaA1/EpsC-like NDP-sugar epimerase